MFINDKTKISVNQKTIALPRNDAHTFQKTRSIRGFIYGMNLYFRMIFLFFFIIMGSYKEGAQLLPDAAVSGCKSGGFGSLFQGVTVTSLLFKKNKIKIIKTRPVK
jgi:hypothetical protein